MSSIPKPDKKPKYNQNKPYEWVDGQWEKFMTKQKELENEIVNLTGKIKNDMDYIRMLEGSVEDLKKERLELYMKNAELKDMVLDNGGDYTETDGYEVGPWDTKEYISDITTNDKSNISHGFEIEKVKKYIYESPDHGRTVYRREVGKEERVLMEGFISGHMVWKEVPRIPEEENPNQLNLFND